MAKQTGHPNGTHPCDIPSCGETLPLNMTWCERHYAMMPDHVQGELWAAARGGIGTSHRYNRNLQACRTALDWFEDNLDANGNRKEST